MDLYTIQTRKEIENLLNDFDIDDSKALMISAILTDRFSMIRRKQK